MNTTEHQTEKAKQNVSGCAAAHPTDQQRNETGSALKHHACDSCEVVYINGLKCHETGCPKAWRDYTLECKWCGSMFKPEEKYQAFCSEDCGESYMS